MRLFIVALAALALASCSILNPKTISASCQVNAAGQPASKSEQVLCQGTANFQTSLASINSKIAGGAQVAQADAKMLCGYLPWVKGLFDVAVVGAATVGHPIDASVVADANLGSTIGGTACQAADHATAAVAQGNVAQTVQVVAGAVKSIEADLKTVAPAVAAAAANPASAAPAPAPGS